MRTWAHGGEGTLATSCHAPQGYDQTSGDFAFFQFSPPKCDFRRPQVDDYPTCDGTEMSQVENPDLRPPQVRKKIMQKNYPGVWS